MIVNPTQSGWEVIYQPAHALLAAQIASHWHEDQRPSRWVETLVALAQHDDEARDWSGRHHLTVSGAPLDFSLNEIPSLIQPRQITQDLQYKGQWGALLISMHMVFLYHHLQNESQEFADFLDEQIEHQRNWRKALKITKDEAERAYALFQWCDRMSLILCRRELPEAGRALEVSAGPDGTRYDVLCQEDRVTVDPWPFQDSHFTVSVEAMCLSELSFEDDSDLQSALQVAPVEYLTWEFEK
jgi:hypothetical protein